VAEKLLGKFQIAGLGVDETGCRVPEGVKSSAAFRPRDLKPVQNRVEDVPSEYLLS
jgi:hypothetical protein